MTTRRRAAARRPGTFVPLLAVCIPALLGFVALAVDLGMMTVARTHCQSAADTAALVGCRVLSNKTTVTNNDASAAMTAARDVTTANKFFGAAFTAAQISNIRVGVYDYNTTTNQFDPPTQWGTGWAPGGGGSPSPGAAPTGKSWTAIEVTVAVQQPTSFARIFGVTTMSNGAKALAVHRPRDVAFVLDYSGSMGNASSPVWPYNDNTTTVVGLNGPDTNWPKFAHYARYTAYTVTPNTGSYNVANANATLRPCPLQNHSTYSNGSYAYAASNTSGLSRGGTSMMEGTYSDDGSTMTPSGFCEAVGNPSTINSTTVFNTAFSWGPPRTAKGNTLTLTQPTYDFSAYDPAGRITTPAPPEFATQADASATAYLGDKWPRTDGGRGPSGAWSTWVSGNTWTENWAQTLKQFLGVPNAGTAVTGIPPGPTTFDSDANGADGRRIVTATAGRTHVYPTGEDATYGAPPSTTTTTTTNPVRDGGSTDLNYRDSIWETYGYDLDAASYRAAGSPKTVTLLAADQRFKGYSMGPGYWGKTFFLWPPDPRWGTPGTGAVNQATMAPHAINTANPVKDTAGNWIADWRCRFFLRGDSTPSTPRYFDPQTDNINGILFANSRNTTSGAYTISAGPVLVQPTATIAAGNDATNQPGYYDINYKAILAWIKAGPKVFPGNLRAGRQVYYKSIPDDCDISGTATTDLNMDKRFWREYIHFVLGVGQFDSTNYPITTPVASTPHLCLAGTELNLGLSLSVGVPAAFQPDPTATPSPPPPNPRPYMVHTDNINRPRLHFWFGPLSMVHFIEYGGQNLRPWYAGTIREAQCWQLKAAMTSVLDDMRTNHPNDNCGLSFFAARGTFTGPRAPMGQDWFTLKNALYFRKNVVNILKVYPDDPIEYRPYDSDFANTGQDEIPNSQGGTDPNNGLAVAYNLLSSSTSLTQYQSVTSPAGNTVSNAPLYGLRGRRGSAKIVVFETDGVPNSTTTWRYTGTGANTYFTTGSGTTPSTTGISSVNSNANDALAVAKIIVANTTATPPGFSLPNTKCRIYSIGFGDIFEGWPTYSSMLTSGQNAHDFMLDVQQMGFTSGSADTRLPDRNIITGPYEQPDPTQPTSASNPLGRIELLRDCLQRIMQSGVQVTLIQ